MTRLVYIAWDIYVYNTNGSFIINFFLDTRIRHFFYRHHHSLFSKFWSLHFQSSIRFRITSENHQIFSTSSVILGDNLVPCNHPVLIKYPSELKVCVGAEWLWEFWHLSISWCFDIWTYAWQCFERRLQHAYLTPPSRSLPFLLKTYPSTSNITIPVLVFTYLTEI